MNGPQQKPRFAKKSLGQNFLVDQNIVSKIVSALELDSTDTVIEIGPGRGALTEILAGIAGQVVAIELDRELVPMLRAKFAGREKVEIIEEDALNIDFGQFAKSEPVKLVANLPYYISTAILQRLIEQRSAFSEMVLMFQREVVERITAPPGDSERGFLTVLAEAYLYSEKLFDVPPTAFRPVPKVWSSVVRLRPKPGGLLNEAQLRRLVSAAFAQKRKTILNNLKSLYPNAGDLLRSAGIDPNRRAETLTAIEWAELIETAGNALQ
jgi:16S rRNA (adenine1518-N6/adenine1519-N6)-dimethyltransferase